jgi:dienelactone hydrolase
MGASRDLPAAARPVTMRADGIDLDADVTVPADPAGVVIFAHGSGSGRRSPRNQSVAQALHAARLATVLLDLLTSEEAREDERTGRLRFDVGLLGTRVTGAIDWLQGERELARLPVGCFGASTGAAAALLAAAERRERVAAVVSRGGRPDLAEHALGRVAAPTLLIVGGRDPEVLRLNRAAQAALPGVCELQVIPGATHLFEEPGALEQVAELTCAWFERRLAEARR